MNLHVRNWPDVLLKEKSIVQSSAYKNIIRDWRLYVLLLPTLIYVSIFCYIPMYGVLMAFQNYKPNLGLWRSTWVGFEQFTRFFNSPMFKLVLTNTLSISVYSLIAGFPIPIIFAIALNYLKYDKYKRLIQTVSYAPHFISTVVMVSMLLIFLSPKTGIVNYMLGLFNIEKIFFMADPTLFKHIYVWSGVWQSIGWSSIIYLAALSTVDVSLYESATIDGASKLKMIYYIDIPSILPTIVILLILNLGNIMSVGYEKVYLMQNSLNIDASEVISTYVYKVGLVGGQYSFSAAVGLFNSLINVIMLVTVNKISRSLNETSLW